MDGMRSSRLDDLIVVLLFFSFRTPLLSADGVECGVFFLSLAPVFRRCVDARLGICTARNIPPPPQPYSFLRHERLCSLIRLLRSSLSVCLLPSDAQSQDSLVLLDEALMRGMLDKEHLDSTPKNACREADARGRDLLVIGLLG